MRKRKNGRQWDDEIKISVVRGLKVFEKPFVLGSNPLGRTGGQDTDDVFDAAQGVVLRGRGVVVGIGARGDLAKEQVVACLRAQVEAVGDSLDMGVEHRLVLVVER